MQCVQVYGAVREVIHFLLYFGCRRRFEPGEFHSFDGGESKGAGNENGNQKACNAVD